MKDLRYLRLFDVYGQLLTGHRREVCELYYLYDLSLTEIAEQQGTTKQSVSDTLAKSRALLDGYEQKLHFSARMQAAEAGLAALVKQFPACAEAANVISAALRGGEEKTDAASD